MKHHKIISRALKLGATLVENKANRDHPAIAMTTDKLEKFIAQFVADHAEVSATVEREACARHLDKQNTAMTDMLAAEIRARGQKK